MWICSCSVSIPFLLHYSYSNVVQAREKGNRNKSEIQCEIENFDLVENFAVTNFSTKPGYHCITCIVP